VLVAGTALALMLELTGTAYRTYFDGAQFINFLLGPAVVALAVPLHRRRAEIRAAAGPLLAGIGVGALVGIASAAGIAWLLGASDAVVVSAAPKSVTTPVAIGLAEQLDGIPALTAALAVATGVLGAVIGPRLLTLVGVRDPRATGLALGVASHGIGTARALQEDEEAGAFSSIGFACCAVLTALVLPALSGVLPSP
jgi:predicted murein hydrolase (TIGR00659 family)